MSLLLLAWSVAATAEREIALTFDDAPRPNGPFLNGEERTAALIEALARADVAEALFFVVTGQIDDDEKAARVRAYTDAGHTLASHSHSHPWLSRTDPAEYLADIDRSLELLEPFDRVLPLYRFPFLDEGRAVGRRDAVRAGLAERGLTNGYVTVDNYDWYLAALAREMVESGEPVDREALGRAYVEILLACVEFYDAIAVETLGRSPKHVLLLHENDLAALFIADLVAALRDSGWTIIPASRAYDDPIAQVQPDTVMLGQGRVAAMARVAGRPGRELVHESEDEAWLRAEFERRGLLPPAP
ncbi:MAG: polysaccharide deacetylase family protein [Pseudomonadota bacterium]